MVRYQPTYQIVAGLVRQGHQVLLVQQRGPRDPHPTWALPGGGVEQGESLTNALRREILEETGLRVQSLGPLLYVMQMEDRAAGDTVTAFIFEVGEWEGELNPGDPDELILQADFFMPSEALEKLDSLDWRTMREPVQAFLRGERRQGTVWVYRKTEDEQVELVEVLP